MNIKRIQHHCFQNFPLSENINYLSKLQVRKFRFRENILSAKHVHVLAFFW